MIKLTIAERWRSNLHLGIEEIEPHHILPLLHDVLTMTEADLQLKLVDYLTELGYTPTFVNNGSESYIYALGKEPWLLVAHTDTVMPTPTQLFVQNELFGDNLFLLSGKGGLGADDRAGVAAMILYLASGLRPSIFLPSGEEKGGLGTKAFIKNDMNVFVDKINFMIQFDRQSSHDAVQYTDTNQSLMNIFTKEYFKTAIGSYTDISDLMPAFGISALNLSIGYDHQHTAVETLDVFAFLSCLKAAYQVLTTMDLSLKHTYVKAAPVVIDYDTPRYSSFDWSSYSYTTTSTKSKTSSPIYECDLCEAPSEDLINVTDVSVCKNCLHEPSNNLINSIYGYCPTCDQHHLLDLHSIFGKIVLVASATDLDFSVACPDCCDALFEVNFDVKVTPTVTLREFIASRLKGFKNE
jgi:hypothetical protein